MADDLLHAVPRQPYLASEFPNDSDVTGTTIADALNWLDDNKQPLDATLTALAGLTIAANTITIGTGADAFSQTSFAANTFPARASTGNIAAQPITDFGLSLVDDADAATARTTLGLGALATVTPGSGIATFLGTPSSANLIAAMTDETGTGSLVFSVSPTFTGTIGAENLTLTGNLSVQGNTTIGNASGDTLTLHAAAWSIPNAVTITKTAQSSTAETLMTWAVSDDAVSKFEIINGSAADAAFSPTFKGTRSGAGVGMTYVGNAMADTGPNPLFLFRSTINNAGVSTRPLLALWNNLTSAIEVTAGYNVQLKGGSTSPTVAGAAEDVVSYVGFDRINTRHAAAGNRVMAVQSERGSAIYVGDDAVDFGASTAIISVGGVDVTLTATTIAMPQKISSYNGASTAGWGVPAIYGHGRHTGQTAAVASVATYTVGAADGSFVVSANVLVTASSSHDFGVTVSYTDESNTPRAFSVLFSVVGGSTATSVNSATAYNGFPLHIRAKAGTAITIFTAGTFTSVTYNVEGSITQIA